MSQNNNTDFSKFIDFLYTIENDLCDNLNQKIMQNNNIIKNLDKTITQNKTQPQHAIHNNTTKNKLKQPRLFNFLPTYTSARPFISHQNRWEQVDDVNRQYIKKVTQKLHNANSSQQKQNDWDEFDKIINNIRKGNDYAIPSQQHTPHDNSRREWVNHPQHYNPGTYETWRIINEYGLDKDFYLATALRYILRAGKKYHNTFAEDLRKAIWYLDKRASTWENDNEL